MMINFDEMPNDSRIWIYQSNRKFSQSEENEISIKIQTFLKDWTAHGSNLFSSYCIRYNRFIVIALNETKNKATGCSIDASVALIQSLEKDYGIDLAIWISMIQFIRKKLKLLCNPMWRGVLPSNTSFK